MRVRRTHLVKGFDSELIGDAVRCTCNKLLMTILGDAIIVKCSRCKRFLVVQTGGIHSIQVHDLNDEELGRMLRCCVPPDE